MPPVYAPRNLAAPIATSMMASLTSISSRHTGQRYRYSSGGGPNGSSRASGGLGSGCWRRLFPPLHGRELITDEAPGRMPDTPDLPGAGTVRTAEGGSPRALLVALAVGHRCKDFDRALDDAFDLGQGLMNHLLDPRKRLGGLDPVIPDALEAFGQDMLHHPADKRVDVDSFPFHPLRLMGAIMRGDVVPIIAIDAPQRDRRAPHKRDHK